MGLRTGRVTPGRLVSVLALLVVATGAAGAEKQAAVLLEQTLDGVTVRLTAAKWCTLQDLGRKAASGVDPREKGLAVWYEVETVAPAIQGAVKGKLARHLTSVRAPGETGRPLAIEWQQDRQWVWWSGADPRWDKAPLEFELLDPRAPAEATGEFTDPLTFERIPVPPGDGTVIDVNRTLTTPRGTVVTLEKVGLRTDRSKEILFVMRWLPPRDVPDLYAHPVWTGGRVVDDTGAALPERGRGWHAGDELEGKPGRETLRAPAEFAPGAKTCEVTVRVEERATSLRQEAWYRRFRFELPLQGIPFEAEATESPPLGRAHGEHVTVTLESFEAMRPGPTPPREYRARLWIVPKDDAPAAPRLWLLKRVTATDDAGNEYLGAVGFQRLLWRADGTPVRPGEWGWSVRPTCFGRRQGTPTKLNAQAEMVAIDRFERVLEFADLSLPKPGEFIEILNKAEATGAGGQFVVRRIGCFTEEELPLTLSDGAKETFRPPVGVAVVAQYLPPEPGPEGAAIPEVKPYLWCEAAIDDQGRSLKERRQSTQTLDGDAFAEKTSEHGTWRTFLLTPPWPDSHTLRLTFRVSETIDAGITETVTFDRIPAMEPARDPP